MIHSSGGRSLLLAGAVMLAAGPAWAQAPREPPLSLQGVLLNAAVPVQVVMLALIVGAVVSLGLWGAGLAKVGKGDARGLAGSLGRLRIVRSAGAPLGALAASFTLMSGFIGLANVSPQPSLAVLAPGWAEAALAVMLGLLATSVAVICERHLESAIRRAAA